MAISFDFGSTALQSGDYKINKTDAFSAPDMDMKRLERARRDGDVLLFDRLKGREINAEGYIRTSTSLLLKTAMDNLKALMLAGKLPLKITEDSEYRQWAEAKLKNINIAREGQDVTFAAFSLQFQTEEPFAVDGNNDTLLTKTGLTAGTSSDAITALGTYITYPTILITINSVSPATAIEISVKNPVTTQELRITDVFAAGDTLSIDCFNKRTLHNGNLISPEGRYPGWVKGAGTFEYGDTATSRNVDISVTHARKWL